MIFKGYSRIGIEYIITRRVSFQGAVCYDSKMRWTFVISIKFYFSSLNTRLFIEKTNVF